MLVIVSVRRLDIKRIEIGVARPQHDSNPTHNYAMRQDCRGEVQRLRSCQLCRLSNLVLRRILL
jgi:hypothetical protein